MTVNETKLRLREMAALLSAWVWQQHQAGTLKRDELEIQILEKLEGAKVIGFMEGVDCDDLPVPPILWQGEKPIP